jgi:UDPglucose 6-dehydrogenase
MKVAIIGNGWVGKAQNQLFPNAYLFSRHMGSKREVNRCDIAFICVPTPNFNESELEIYEAIQDELDTSIVEECIKWCKCSLIVVRSTVNPGDCDRWAKEYNKRIVMQPEYLGESPAHPLLDTKQTNFLILGGELQDTRQLIELYQTVYNANVKIRQVSRLEAEVIKLSENRAIAYKVAQCQELYDVCELAEVDFYTIREAVYGDDPRFNLWWSFIYPNKRGANSKCIPKDVYAWCAWAESLGYEPKITRALLEKNKEWIESNNKTEQELKDYYNGK